MLAATTETDGLARRPSGQSAVRRAIQAGSVLGVGATSDTAQIAGTRLSVAGILPFPNVATHIEQPREATLAAFRAANWDCSSRAIVRTIAGRRRVGCAVGESPGPTAATCVVPLALRGVREIRVRIRATANPTAESLLRPEAIGARITPIQVHHWVELLGARSRPPAVGHKARVACALWRLRARGRIGAQELTVGSVGDLCGVNTIAPCSHLHHRRARTAARIFTLATRSGIPRRSVGRGVAGRSAARLGSDIGAAIHTCLVSSIQRAVSDRLRLRASDGQSRRRRDQRKSPHYAAWLRHRRRTSTSPSRARAQAAAGPVGVPLGA